MFVLVRPFLTVYPHATRVMLIATKTLQTAVRQICQPASRIVELVEWYVFRGRTLPPLAQRESADSHATRAMLIATKTLQTAVRQTCQPTPRTVELAA